MNDTADAGKMAQAEAPAWMPGVAKDVMSYRQQHLIDEMLEHDEDVTDNALWHLRCSQLAASLREEGKS